MRDEMSRSAVRLAAAAGYSNAGTVEFLLDRNGKYYFIEMNARIQVEHPVTEMVTGIDLVIEQLRIASGEKLRFRQKDIEFRGCAIECRINAEDPTNGYAPSPGLIETFVPPGGMGVRLDTHVHAGYTVPPTYDSLICKLIVHRPTRREAIACMRRSLEEFTIRGIKTTIPLLVELFGNKRYIKGNIDTSFIENLVPRG